MAKNISFIIGILRDIDLPDHQKYYVRDENNSYRIMIFQNGNWKEHLSINMKSIQNRKIINLV